MLCNTTAAFAAAATAAAAAATAVAASDAVMQGLKPVHIL